MQIEVRSPNAGKIAAEILGMSVNAGPRVTAVTRHFGQLLLTRVMARASGRPGPNVVTGDYRRSWNLQMTTDGHGNPVASVGTNNPQGRRLEFGFHGTDSLGRRYNQPPFPHARPALQSVEREYIKALSVAVVPVR